MTISMGFEGSVAGADFISFNDFFGDKDRAWKKK